MRIIAIGFCTLALLPAISGAQQTFKPGLEQSSTSPSAQQSVKAVPLGPTIQSAAVGFRVAADNNAALKAAAPVRRGQGQDVALMVVGVGAMVVGALVGNTAGTIILIGGAAMALWGLYNYLE